MFQLRKADQRGHSQLGWLDSRHTFSFGEYFDPRHKGFRDLRVINEDRVQPGKGFGTHPHRDMEIITWVLEGALQHSDSLGNGSVIRPGDVQRMTAGTGVMHSEFNASQTEPVHFLQIWILPDRTGLAPGYEQKSFTTASRRGKLRLVASKDGRDGSVSLNQNAAMHVASLKSGDQVEHAIGPGRAAWLQVTAGEVAVDGQVLSAGDGAAITQVKRLAIEARQDSGIVLFDLP